MQTTVLIINIILDIAFIPSLVLIYLSAFIFDNGTDGTDRWILFALFNGVPISILITQIISWISYSNGNYDFAFKISLIPFVIIFLIGLSFLKSQFS